MVPLDHDLPQHCWPQVVSRSVCAVVAPNPLMHGEVCGGCPCLSKALASGSWFLGVPLQGVSL